MKQQNRMKQPLTLNLRSAKMQNRFSQAIMNLRLIIDEENALIPLVTPYSPDWTDIMDCWAQRSMRERILNAVEKAGKQGYELLTWLFERGCWVVTLSKLSYGYTFCAALFEQSGMRIYNSRGRLLNQKRTLLDKLLLVNSPSEVWQITDSVN